MIAQKADSALLGLVPVKIKYKFMFPQFFCSNFSTNQVNLTKPTVCDLMRINIIKNVGFKGKKGMLGGGSKCTIWSGLIQDNCLSFQLEYA